MATRHNACVNPCLTVDADGWAGSPTRTAVSVFDRPFAARYVSGTFSNTARGAVIAGQAFTVSESVYIDNPAGTISGTYFVEWRDAAANVLSYDTGGYSVPGRTAARISVTHTAPASAAFVSLITEGYNFTSGAGDFTECLIEASAVQLDYFDGDSSGGSWDGTPGNSPSTLTDAAVVTASGPAGGLWLRAGAGAVSVSNRPAGTAGKTRLSGAAGAVLAVRRAPLVGAAAAVRLRPGAGAVNAAQPVPALLSGRSGRIVGWASPGVVAAVREAPCRGRAGVLLVRAGRGEVTGVVPEPTAGPGSMAGRQRRTAEMTTSVRPGAGMSPRAR